MQAGQEVYKSITRSYYRGTIGAVLVYDISSRGSFNNVLRWIEETRTYATNDRISILLVANKADLEHRYLPLHAVARSARRRDRH
jgi:small GTP-binding protein